MERATFTVLFYIKRTKVLRDGMIPIYVRVTIDGQRAEFGLHKSIKDDQWDKRKGCFKGYSKEAKKLNSYLDLVKSKIRQQSFRLILS